MITFVRSLLWAGLLRLRGARVGKRFRVHGSLKILLRDGATLRNLHLGDDVTFGGRVYLRIRRQGRIHLGDGVRTGTEIWLVAANEAALEVEDGAVLGSYNILNAGHGLRIGAGSLTGAFVYLNTSDHGFKRGTPIQEQGFFGAPIDIGADVWLGGHVFVNKGICIGEGTVVGSGAVVTRDLPPNVIALGNPARVHRERPEADDEFYRRAA
jgi:acetyltransferase-like isoleucine patch superfamily enzyme